jgi:GNAT superfamily N-acetyltransferase
MSLSEMFDRMEIARFPARILRKWREVGPLYALQMTYWEIFPNWLFDINAWVVLATDIRKHAANRSHDPAIRWATETDIDALAACGVDRRKILKALKGDVRIALLERDGRVLVHGWYGATMHEQDDWLTFRLKPGDLMGASIWVRPDCRGQGLAPRVIGFVWSEMARAGRVRSVGIINVLNRNSRRAIAKNGSTVVGRLFYIRFLGLTYIRYGVLKKIGFWNPRNRLDLTLAD